MGEQIGLI